MVGQQVHHEVVDVVDQLGVGEPDVPGLGGGDRRTLPLAELAADVGAHAVEMGGHFLDRHFLAQQGFVAYHDAFDVLVFLEESEPSGDLALGEFLVGRHPQAHGHLEAFLFGQRIDGGDVGDAVGTDAVGVVAQDVEVFGHLFGRGVFLLQG